MKQKIVSHTCSQSKMLEPSREKGLEKYGEVWREVWKTEGEIKNREEEWKATMEEEFWNFWIP